MARAPLLQLNGISLGLGADRLFDDLDLVIHPGDRVALVGRNGSGKSTLMRVLAGLAEPDSGERVVPPGISVGYMEQDPDFAGFATLGDFAAAGLDPLALAGRRVRLRGWITEFNGPMIALTGAWQVEVVE